MGLIFSAYFTYLIIESYLLIFNQEREDNNMRIRVEFRRSFIRKMILIAMAFSCALCIILGVSIGKKLEKRTVESEDIYVDNGIEDLKNKRSTEYAKFIYYDSMDKDENGDYYVNTGIGGMQSHDKGTYSKAHFSKEYVECKMNEGVEGEVVMVNRSLYDINK
jgi:hypothetical protein